MKRRKLDTETCKEGRWCKETERRWLSARQGQWPETDSCLPALRQNQPCWHLESGQLQLQLSRFSRVQCLTLWDPIDSSPPGSSVPGIPQARVLEWAVISFSNACMHACWVVSVVSDSVPPHRQQPTRLLRPWDSPGKNTGVGCHFLL